MQNASMLSEETRQLLTWYDRERRILPWREDPTPYHIWLSEIMLQQTRVEAGKAYYLRFLNTLPDIASLAAAPEEVYLKLWEGLGYYSRVRNLHKAAVLVMEEYGGELPGTAQELRKLPGIGPYSAAAIASIAFGQPEIALDGNLLRVFSRMMAYSGDIKSPQTRKAAEEYYRERIPADRPGDFNQALMDLGAGICLPNGDPECLRCPWAGHCRSHELHRETDYPVMPPKKARRKENRTILLLRSGDRVAIRKRPKEGLLAGMYEFPGAEGHLSPAGAVKYACDLSGATEGQAGIPQRLPDARHVFSHIEWNMIGYAIPVPQNAENGLCWVTRGELERNYAIPSAFEAYRVLV